jgi:hypothetical protein
MRWNKQQAAERKRVIDLVTAGATYTTVAVRTGLSRNAVAGIMFRHKNPEFKSSWRKTPKRKLIAFAGAETASH